MSEPFLGELRMFGFDWPPVGWARCDGAILTPQQQPALFSLLGATFGGNGNTTFGLPDLRGRVPLHPDGGTFGQGRALGQETVTLTAKTLPVHTHFFRASSEPGNKIRPPLDTAVLARSTPAEPSYTQSPQIVEMHPDTGSDAGGGGSHNNIQPSLAIGFCIAMAGIYPQRS
jgi:microcystin-dependent protein